ncbi:MAG TPA: CBS domain-containing protein [Candidatus Udaeobacter sp.]|nr:CBS domain-containing protein [Candidatus Udaeobacter sp.]
MKVRSVFHAAVACLGPGASLTNAANLMRAGEFGSVAIFEGDRLTGILTETDIVRAVSEHRDLDSTALSEYMSLDPVTAGPEEDSMDVAFRMVQGGFRHLPVVEDGKLIGMVSARDLLEVEAWPPARLRQQTGAGSVDLPVRPRRHQLVEQGPRTEMRAGTRKVASPQAGEVSIPVGDRAIVGDLAVPADAIGIVLFAHGTGSSRHSPRNRFVAGELQKSRIATLLMDLLTLEEERLDEMTEGSLRFDIGLLASRLEAASDWVRSSPSTKDLPIGYFGASTGAAAALLAAGAEWRGKVSAVVSRGGRPDLARDALGAVRAPTLLIVGGDDDAVIRLNRQALASLACEKQLEIVPGATHLFEEPGTLDQVAVLAADWFARHLSHG